MSPLNMSIKHIGIGTSPFKYNRKTYRDKKIKNATFQLPPSNMVRQTEIGFQENEIQSTISCSPK